MPSSSNWRIVKGVRNSWEASAEKRLMCSKAASSLSIMRFRDIERRSNSSPDRITGRRSLKFGEVIPSALFVISSTGCRDRLMSQYPAATARERDHERHVDRTSQQKLMQHYLDLMVRGSAFDSKFSRAPAAR